MSYDELMEAICRELPHLRGQLSNARAVYVPEQRKLYVTFESMTLVEEASFLKMERILRRAFPQRNLALRVISPGLKDDFTAHIDRYNQVLADFLKRNYPASVSWMNEIGWSCTGQRITLSFPNEFAREYMAKQNVAARLARAVKDIFAAEVTVELTVAGDHEKRLA